MYNVQTYLACMNKVGTVTYIHGFVVLKLAWSLTHILYSCFIDTGQSWISLRWRHNGRDIVSNHQPHDCLLNRLFRRRSKKTSTLRVTGLCVGNSPGTGEFPAQMASNAEYVSIWWRHHVPCCLWAALWCVLYVHPIHISLFQSSI